MVEGAAADVGTKWRLARREAGGAAGRYVGMTFRKGLGISVGMGVGRRVGREDAREGSWEGG